MSQKKDDDYVMDVPYTWEFFDFQSPTTLNYLARHTGVESVDINEPFTYCELGCGNGVTAALLAAALPKGKFYATDFNPEHITNAQRIAKAGKLNNIAFSTHSFADMLNADFPQFDYITLHGVYSWVSETIREEIIAVIERYLKPNGVLYVSYNPLPRWAEILPLWRMMMEHTKDMNVSSLEKAEAGLNHLQYLREIGIQYFRNTPSASHFLDELLERDISFVTHEFCNNYLDPQYFIDVAATMKSIGLQYCGAAGLDDNDSHIPDGMLDYLDQADNKTERESRRSILSNEFFRRDVYSKSALPLMGDAPINTNIQRPFSLLDKQVIGSRYSDFHIHRQFPAYKSEAAFQAPLYDLLIKHTYQGRKTVKELCAEDDLSVFSSTKISNALYELIAAEHLELFAQKATKPYQHRNKSLKLSITLPINRFILHKRLVIEGECYLASCVLGSAVNLALVPSVCLWAYSNHKTKNKNVFIKSTLLAAKAHWEKQEEMEGIKEVTTSWIENQRLQFEQGWLPLLVRYGVVHISAK